MAPSSSSDEMIFAVDRTFDRWNDYCIVSSSIEVYHTMTTKYPAGVLAFQVLKYFFNEDKKVNAEVFCKVLEDKIIH